MPLAGPRRSDAQPRQEYFDDHTGAITLEIGFHPVHGVFVSEIFEMKDRRTHGENTAIMIETLSRVRADELRSKITTALAASYEKDAGSLRTDVDMLLSTLRVRLDAFIGDPTNIERVVDAKEPLLLIGLALDQRRKDALLRQRNVVLGVLLDDLQLKQTP